MIDEKKVQTKIHSRNLNKQIDGVIIGLLVGFNEDGQPLVAYPGNPDETAVIARATTHMDEKTLGKEIAILFEQGDLSKPLIIGQIQHHRQQVENEAKQLTAKLDGEHLVLSAEKNITLKCGKASITLTKAGKILIRGDYVLSRSSGVNRIKGGSVQIN